MVTVANCLRPAGPFRGAAALDLGFNVRQRQKKLAYNQLKFAVLYAVQKAYVF